jgi:hypothetical protein
VFGQVIEEILEGGRKPTFPAIVIGASLKLRDAAEEQIAKSGYAPELSVHIRDLQQISEHMLHQPPEVLRRYRQVDPLDQPRRRKPRKA